MSEDFKGRILVYSTSGCSHCIQAKSTLKDLGVPYTDVNLSFHPSEIKTVLSLTGKNTVPQIFFNEKYIGGNGELQDLAFDDEEWEKTVIYLANTPPPPNAPSPPTSAPLAYGVALTGEGEEEDETMTCERDEFATIAWNLQKSGVLKTRRQGMSSINNSCTGADLLDWIVKTKVVDRESALALCQSLLERHFISQVKDKPEFTSDKTLYRLLDPEHSTALNAGPLNHCPPRPVGELGEALRKLMLKLHAEHISEDGKHVNYVAIGESASFKSYLKLTQELQRAPVDRVSRDEKVAFFINVYNALVVHATVAVGPATSLWKRYKFFNNARYIIGGLRYSLQDIENGVLRANRKGVGMLRKPFSSSDPRASVALTEPEPLVHFALVCGARSCPPIRTYSAEGISGQLRVSARAFLEGDDGLKIIDNEIRLSKILDWYKVDFGGTNTKVVEFIMNVLPETDEKRKKVAELYKSGKFKVKFMDYDWSVNS